MKNIFTTLAIMICLISTSINAQEVVYRRVKICTEENIQKAKEISKNKVAKPQPTRYKSVNVEYDDGRYIQSRTRTYQSAGPIFSFGSRMGCSTSG